MDTGQETAGIIFNIQQFSVHDGPGIRTIVFLKGCPLRCRWCCNPESQNPQPELAFDPKKCIGMSECGLCLRCGQNAVETLEDGKVRINRDVCTDCGTCAADCPSKALEMIGRQMTVEEALSAAEKDHCFYSRSGGGLTLSGGEPLFQPDFAIGLLKGAKRIGMDTAIETCGQVKWEILEEALRHVNTIMYDIKCIDSQKHKEFTGSSNPQILENFKALCAAFPNVSKVVRTPIVPGFNDDPVEIESISRFLKPFPDVKHEFLPYHRFGELKYELMGMPYLLTDIRPPDAEHMTSLRRKVPDAL